MRQELTPIQYQVTKHNATEPPFQNEYWNHEEEGIYVDIIQVNLYLVRRINTMLVVVGQVLQNHFVKVKLRKSSILPME